FRKLEKFDRLPPRARGARGDDESGLFLRRHHRRRPPILEGARRAGTLTRVLWGEDARAAKQYSSSTPEV
ncbi:unnamed protein product, partial [Urochloa humidicola]